MEEVLSVSAFLFIVGVITALVAKNRGREPAPWFFIGFFLGPLGLALLFGIEKNQKRLDESSIDRGAMKRCPFCAEIVRKDAIICRYCKQPLEKDQGLSSSEEHGDVITVTCPKCSHSDIYLRKIFTTAITCEGCGHKIPY